MVPDLLTQEKLQPMRLHDQPQAWLNHSQHEKADHHLFQTEARERLVPETQLEVTNIDQTQVEVKTFRILLRLPAGRLRE